MSRRKSPSGGDTPEAQTASEEVILPEDVRDEAEDWYGEDFGDFEDWSEEDTEDLSMPFSHNPYNVQVFDQLERMLNRIHKSRDHAPLMYVLRNQMGSAYSMFHTDNYFLERLGMNHLDAFFFGNFLDLLRGVEIAGYGEHPRIARFSEAKDYIAANFRHLEIERFYLYCVNCHGKLKERILMNEGIEDRALLSIQQLVSHVLRTRPLAVIVAHNHPNGNPMPSRNDIECTVSIIHALLALGVPLLDHLVATDETVVSIRENGFIPEHEWLMQTKNNFLLRDWFLPPLERKPRKRKPRTPEEERKRVERELRFSRSRRLRKMDKAMRMYRHHSKNADKCMKVYRSLSSKDDRMQREDMQRRIRRKVEIYLHRYERAYQRWQQEEALKKQQKRGRKRSKPPETDPQD